MLATGASASSRHRAHSLHRRDVIAGGRFSLDRHESVYGSSGHPQFPARFTFRRWKAEIEKATDVAVAYWPEGGGSGDGRAEVLHILLAR